MQRRCSGATEGRGCHAWSSFHVLILKEEEGYRAHEEAVSEEKRCNCVRGFGCTSPVLPFQMLTEFLTFLLLRDYAGWNYWPHHSRVHLSSFNFGFTVWFSQAKAMLAEVQGLLVWPGSLSVITVRACPSLILAWLQDEKRGADLNETHSLDQDQLIYILKPIRFSWPRSAKWQFICRQEWVV